MNVELWWAEGENTPGHSRGEAASRGAGRGRLVARGDADAAARRDSTVARSAYPGLFTSPVRSVRGWFWREAGRRIAAPRHSAAVRRILRHVVRAGASAGPVARLAAGKTVVRGMLAQLSSAGHRGLAYLVGRDFHVGHDGPRSRLASTTLPSHAFHAAPHEHRPVAGAASPRKPYL